MITTPHYNLKKPERIDFVIIDDLNYNADEIDKALYELASKEGYDDAEILDILAKKVDKVAGKSLSTNDYTDADKQKLGNLPTGDALNTHLTATPASAGGVHGMIGWKTATLAVANWATDNTYQDYPNAYTVTDANVAIADDVEAHALNAADAIAEADANFWGWVQTQNGSFVLRCENKPTAAIQIRYKVSKGV